jgi:hypothetical protein
MSISYYTQDRTVRQFSRAAIWRLILSALTIFWVVIGYVLWAMT